MSLIQEAKMPSLKEKIEAQVVPVEVETKEKVVKKVKSKKK